MNAAEFVTKWRASQQKESAAYVSHFDDLCRLLNHQTPIEADPAGGFFCYQRHVAKKSGRQGFADVWYDRRFGWEYKSKGGDLQVAYRQLLHFTLEQTRVGKAGRSLSPARQNVSKPFEETVRHDSAIVCWCFCLE
jgi:hypothetical protein